MMLVVMATLSTLTLAAAGLLQQSNSVLITNNHTFSESDDAWSERVKHIKAVKIEPGCGRMQNRLVTFDDGSKACVRYRVNANLMQGEIYSHFVGKLIGIPNLPPLALTQPHLKSQQWSRVAAGVLEANWKSNKLIILTKYIKDTKDVFLPPKLKGMNINSISPEDITPKNEDLLTQWSDMIIFDYIIGNMDRLVNSLHNRQWNSNMMDLPVHNLAQKDNSLIFFDNEDGLFHGYRILDRYSNFHEESLKTMCVFRKSTADSILNLVKSDDIAESLTEMIRQKEPTVLKYLPRLSSKTAEVLKQRLSSIADHIQACQEHYFVG